MTEWQESTSGPPRRYYRLTDNGKRTQDGMPEPERLRLPHIDARHVPRNDLLNDLQQVRLAPLTELCFELRRLVEMVFDRTLPASRDEDHFCHAGRNRLFYRILNKRLVDHRHHFLRARLGRRRLPARRCRFNGAAGQNQGLAL